MRSAHLNPALYFKGLLGAVQSRGIRICAKAPVTSFDRSAKGWRLATTRGGIEADDIVVCTNGYTGSVTPELQRRVVPVGSYIIATEELPPDVAASLNNLATTLKQLGQYAEAERMLRRDLAIS